MTESPGRSLLLELVDFPELIADADPTADLATCGVTSNDLIRIAAAVEDRTGAELDDDELLALGTIAGLDSLLRARAGHVGNE